MKPDCNSIEIKETCDDIKIVISKDKILSEMDDRDLIDELKYRCADSDFLSECDTYDLVDELKSRNYDIAKLIDSEELGRLIYENMSNLELPDMINIVCKNATSRKYLDKNDIKEIINDYIDNYF